MTADLRRAVSATLALVRDPLDTPQVFALIEALSGTRTPRGIARRLRSSRLLVERPDIARHLSDRAALRALPEESLGRAYLRFAEAEGITADGLREASERGERDGAPDDDVAFVRARMRDVHDLWHVVLGYRADILGEAALLGFTFAQTRNAAIGVLVGVGLAKLDSRGARALIVRAVWRGLRTAWFPEQEWERLLALPLASVRQTLRAGPPPRYVEVRAPASPAA